MKKINLSFRSTLACGAVFCLLLASCSKQVADAPADADVATNNEAFEKNVNTSDDISLALTPGDVIGNYNSHCEKTIYMGKANADGSNIFIHLNYLNLPKSIVPTADKKHLTTPFGGDGNNGWKYIIGYNKNTRMLVVTPNDALAAAIVPGSFKSLSATYNPTQKTWSFVSRYIGLNDKGNESEVSESFWQE